MISLYSKDSILISIMREIKLNVIPKLESNTKTILEGGIELGNGPYFQGQGGENSTNYVCGNCNHVLGERLEEDAQIRDIVVKCLKCQSYNELDTII
ncbi:MAG: hypothetical protein ACTHJ7_03405 [Candidatus Nitrosocosmicus sp.]